MQDELRPDETQDLWRNQPREPARISADDVRRKARQFEAKTRRSFRIIALIMTCSAACYALLLYSFPGTVQRIGSSLTLAAYLYSVYQLRKRGPARKVSADPPSATCAAYQAELKRVRDFSFISTLMVPFIPGPAVFMMGFLVPEQGLLRAVGLTTAVILSPFVLVMPLLRRRRRTLQREIDALDTLMRSS
jgi:hypothetical protein